MTAYRENFVVYVDDDAHRELVSSTPGPAGVAELDLDNGATITVDYVESQQLVSLHLQAHTRASVISAFIGADRAETVRRAEPHPDGRPFRLIAGDEDSDDGAWQSDQPGRRQPPLPSLQRRASSYDAVQLGRLARLNTVSREERSSPLVQAVASLELAHSISTGDLHHLPGVAALLRPAVSRTASLFAGAKPEITELADQSPDLASRIAEQCRRAGPTNRTLSAIAQLIESRLTPADWHDFPADEVAYQSMFRHSAEHASPVAQSFSLESPLLAVRYSPLTVVPGYTVELSPTGRLRVGFRTKPAGSWVRVLHSTSLMLVALAPVITDDDDDQAAEAVIPTDLVLEQLTIEVTDKPLPASTSALVRTREAIRLAREAADAMSSGNRLGARELWRASATVWDELGDRERAAIARDYATSGMKQDRESMLADEVRTFERHGRR
ncbi:MAG: hypothetical protein WCH93_10995 [Actinomycetota bacterium]